jgi:hypothetical protein
MTFKQRITVFSQGKFFFFGIIIFIFLIRLVYGITAEFWAEDELQIYLIGLKSFTTHTWPYYGPDVVYTSTQIPGALQGLLVSAPWYVWQVPEAPMVLLNIMSFVSLCFISWYVSKRIKTLPRWFIFLWICSLSWTLDFGCRVVNPSYTLIFSVPFFVALIDILPIYETKLLNKKLAFFLLGICPALIMQLHLSFVLLIPFCLLALFFELRYFSGIKNFLVKLLFFIIGIAIGISTLLPTFFLNQPAPSATQNVVVNLENFKNFFTIIFRYLSFASYEIPYMLGPNWKDRFEILNQNPWMYPFTFYLFVFGSISVLFYIYSLVKVKIDEAFKKIKWLLIFGFITTFLSFFFSIKGPSPHTFYVLFPLPLLFSVYCLSWIYCKKNIFRTFLIVAVFSSFFFYSGLIIFNYNHNSLYIDRTKAVNAINEKDYKILGARRTDQWGYGY